MARSSVSDEVIVESITQLGMQGTANKFGLDLRNLHYRRRSLEARLNIKITPKSAVQDYSVKHPERLTFHVDDGWVLVGSDAHYWPNVISTAHRGFVQACKELRPKLVILNGDIFDGASVSRHSPIQWESRPSVQQEIEACTERLDEIKNAAKNADLVWTLGNHDARFESRLAQAAPEYAKVHGVHLKDHFPEWLPCWSIWINDEVVVKHRFKGGMHAPQNNTLWAGKTMVTGHLHSQKVQPITDYNGTRWGVDCGTMADIFAESFRDYMEDSPRNWVSGFGAFRFVDGELLQPMMARVVRDGVIDFMGKLHHV
jgi:hypothetical protein